MSRVDTWMPLYIGDYLADTMHLDAREHGAYLLLLMHYWRSGPLPDDDRLLARIARLDRETWTEETAPVVRTFFVVRDGKLHQKRSDSERANAVEKSAKRRAAGSMGGIARRKRIEASKSAGTGARARGPADGAPGAPGGNGGEAGGSALETGGSSPDPALADGLRFDHSSVEPGSAPSRSSQSSAGPRDRRDPGAAASRTGADAPPDDAGAVAMPQQKGWQNCSLRGRASPSPSQLESKEERELRSLPRSRAARANEAFARFYDAYPRKKDPDDALKAWRHVVGAGADPDEIMAGLQRHQFNPDPRFIKHPAAWLRAGAWRDQPDTRAEPAAGPLAPAGQPGPVQRRPNPVGSGEPRGSTRRPAHNGAIELMLRAKERAAAPHGFGPLPPLQRVANGS